MRRPGCWWETDTVSWQSHPKSDRDEGGWRAVVSGGSFQTRSSATEKGHRVRGATASTVFRTLLGIPTRKGCVELLPVPTANLIAASGEQVTWGGLAGLAVNSCAQVTGTEPYSYCHMWRPFLGCSVFHSGVLCCTLSHNLRNSRGAWWGRLGWGQGQIAAQLSLPLFHHHKALEHFSRTGVRGSWLRVLRCTRHHGGGCCDGLCLLCGQE